MPAIWSSSERPISVRTVWVDGVRHAILTSDDPALVVSRTRRRAQTSPGDRKVYPVNYRCRGDSYDGSSAESLDSCFVKLHVVLDKRERETEISSRIIRRQSAPPQCSRDSNGNTRNLLELRLNGVLNFTGEYSADGSGARSNLTARSSSARESLESSRKSSISTEEIATIKTGDNCTTDYSKASAAGTDFEDRRSTPEIHSNLLSERVLQWMDLSGRGIDYASDEDKDLRAKERYRRAGSSKPRSSGIRRDYPVMSAKEQVSLQNYKMQTERKQQDSDDRQSRGTRRRASKDRESFDKIMMSNCKKGQVNCPTTDEGVEKKWSKEEIRENNQPQSNKTPWPSHGRPQLHIYMPDLNSSGEDVSSEESLIKD